MSNAQNEILKAGIWENHLEKCTKPRGCDCLIEHCVHDSWDREWCDEECEAEVNKAFDNLPQA